MSKKNVPAIQLPIRDEIATEDLILYLAPLKGTFEEIIAANGKREGLAMEMAARVEEDYAQFEKYPWRSEQTYREKMVRLITWINIDVSASRWSQADAHYYHYYQRWSCSFHPFLPEQHEEHISPNDIVDTDHLGWDITMEGATLQYLNRRMFRF